MGDVDELQSFIVNGIDVILGEGMLWFATVGIVMAINWKVASAALAPLLVIGLGLTGCFVADTKLPLCVEAPPDWQCYGKGEDGFLVVYGVGVGPRGGESEPGVTPRLYTRDAAADALDAKLREDQ